jgi:xanthosine utilization system XapX-like protein
MLIGEQALPIAKKLLGREPVTTAWLRSECVAQITGVPPKAAASADPVPGQAPTDRGA